jgi:hypothetical protein
MPADGCPHMSEQFRPVDPPDVKGRGVKVILTLARWRSMQTLGEPHAPVGRMMMQRGCKRPESGDRRPGDCDPGDGLVCVCGRSNRRVATRLARDVVAVPTTCQAQLNTLGLGRE